MSYVEPLSAAYKGETASSVPSVSVQAPEFPTIKVSTAERFDGFRVVPRVQSSQNAAWFSLGPALNPPACVFNVTALAPTSIFQSALQRLQATQDADLHTSIERNLAAISATLAGIYELDASGQNRSAAREIMIFVEARLQKNALSDANQLLAKIDVSHLSSRSMIGLIRSTYRVKKNLPAWRKLYRESWDQVSKLGKNPKALFVGLPSAMDDDVASASK